MSAVAESRINELDRLADTVPAAGLAPQLFAVADAVDASPSLRRALADPTRPEEARAELARTIFDGKTSVAALTLVEGAVRLRWRTASSLPAALDRQGVRAALRGAVDAGTIDAVEDELFRFGRVVDGDHELRRALGDRLVPSVARQQLVTDLLHGKAQPVTEQLARRAVLARERTFDLTITSYVTVAAALRHFLIANVTVARPLSDEQAARLRATLTTQLGRPVTLQVEIDPGVLGGVRVQIGFEVIEGTLAGRLESARRQLS
jgi:F-type H+-transporting ATPase subunit delta